MLINNMSKKVEWVNSGRLFQSEPYMAKLPLPSRFMLPNILLLFNNSLLGIENVLMEATHHYQMTTWVEPLVKYAIRQPNLATRTRVWNNCLSALLAHDMPMKMLNVKTGHNWIEQDQLFQAKKTMVDVDLINKDFLVAMKSKINSYEEQLDK
ncbi:hypothetical protein JVT61DRAFT_13327 [Boletus reticuloceps]|uniref:Uncharacterized protein n=1 Tax=Boletus reticuloceps TaxID=495285 RepID=A0A8I2YDL7_9AGAM|nr:hypothetical protein JVT61DRAFT_13327 [Boletus reticuloceps]